MWEVFTDEYLPHPTNRWGRFRLKSISQDSKVDGATSLQVVLDDAGAEHTIIGIGNGPVAAFADAMAKHGVDVKVLDYHEHAMSSGGDATAAAYLECELGDEILWGVGIDPSIVTSSLKAIVSAVNRSQR